jgi:hypothetical protein
MLTTGEWERKAKKGCTISDRTEDGRRSAHYELKWEIPDSAFSLTLVEVFMVLPN